MAHSPQSSRYIPLCQCVPPKELAHLRPSSSTGQHRWDESLGAKGCQKAQKPVVQSPISQLPALFVGAVLFHFPAQKPSIAPDVPFVRQQMRDMGLRFALLHLSPSESWGQSCFPFAHAAQVPPRVSVRGERYTEVRGAYRLVAVVPTRQTACVVLRIGNLSAQD